MSFKSAVDYVDCFVEENAEYYSFKEAAEFSVQDVLDLDVSEKQINLIKKVIEDIGKYQKVREKLFYRKGMADMVQLLASADIIKIPDLEE